MLFVQLGKKAFLSLEEKKGSNHRKKVKKKIHHGTESDSALTWSDHCQGLVTIITSSFPPASVPQLESVG